MRQEESTAAWLIFYSSETGSWNLYSKVPGSDRLLNLTPDGGDVSYQGVSDDGQWLVYQRQGISELYRTRINTGDTSQITSLENASPASSVNAQTGAAVPLPLFAGTIDGWYIVQQGSRIFGIKNGGLKWLTPPNADVQIIGITPDQEYILYTDYTQDIIQLYRMNPDGTNAIGITPTTERFQFGAWADDGLFAYARSDAGQRLYHVSLHPSDPKLLLDVGEWDRWFGIRDEWVYFARDNNLHRKHVDSGEVQIVATVDIGQLFTITTADGWLFYATFEETLHESRVFRVRPDGSEKSEVLHTQASIDGLMTSPDRKYAIFLGSTESYAFRGDRRWNLPVASSYNFAGWTPDGNEMIFNPTRVACPCNVMTLKPDGTDRKFITDVSKQIFFMTNAPVKDRTWAPMMHFGMGFALLAVGLTWWRVALRGG